MVIRRVQRFARRDRPLADMDTAIVFAVGRCQNSQARMPALCSAGAVSRDFVALPRSARGSLMIELLVAMAILAGILLPIAYSVAGERRFARAVYQRAVAVEMVDGEMEALAAGGWRAFSNGVTDYPIHARAATNLPPGQFTLTMTSEKVRLEWRPNVKQHGGPVVREVGRR